MENNETETKSVETEHHRFYYDKMTLVGNSLRQIDQRYSWEGSIEKGGSCLLVRVHRGMGIGANLAFRIELANFNDEKRLALLAQRIDERFNLQEAVGNMNVVVYLE